MDEKIELIGTNLKSKDSEMTISNLLGLYHQHGDHEIQVWERNLEFKSQLIIYISHLLYNLHLFCPLKVRARIFSCWKSFL